ncbi:MAG: leucine-rich repeat protein [Lachnospiraceae bacterium]|nr:leucine-rich repeat protein [Lachnospiraceae bacterium]
MATVDAKASVKKSGKVDNEIAWSYNSKTKTLTFRPFKSSENPKKIKKHTYDLEYWLENSKKHIYKSGVSRVLRCDALIGSYPHDDYGDAFSKLRKVSLSKSVRVIPPASFEKADKIKSVSMPFVEYIGQDALVQFDVNKKKKIIFPKNVRRIEKNAFKLNSIKYKGALLKLNSGLEYIGANAFSDCKLKKIVIPDSVTTIGSGAFKNSKYLEVLILPNGIGRIESELFCNCKKLSSITLPESITRIDSYAFAYSGLENITVSSNVRTLGDSVFYKCEKLKKIMFRGAEIKSISPNTMKGVSKNVEIVVPTGMKEKYQKMFEGAGLSPDAIIVENDFGEKEPFYKLSKSEVSVKEGFTRRLEVLYLAGCERISVESEDENVANVSVVNGSGEALIKALNVGETVIRIYVDDCELCCKVRVNEADSNNDEEELRKLINTQRKYGATVSKDIHNSSQYTWNNGRLVGINWDCESPYGDIDLNPFTHLTFFDCYGGGLSEPPLYNYIWSIDADDCTELRYIACHGGYLRELHAENAVNLEKVDLDRTSVRVIDVSSATKLQKLEFPYDQKIKKLRINDNVDKENINKWHVDSRVESVEYIVEPR